MPPPGDLPDPGIKPAPPALTGGFLSTAPPGKPVKVEAERDEPGYRRLKESSQRGTLEVEQTFKI